jgi:hypothetical protein
MGSARSGSGEPTPKEHSVSASILNDREPTVELTDSVLDPDKLILEGVDMGEFPTYSVGEVAKFFFAKSPHWIRWNEERGFFTLDGQKVGTTRTTPKVAKVGQRRFTLADVEKMAHALAEKGALPTHELRRTLHLVEAQARLWGYI